MAEYIERQKAIDLFYRVDPENDGSDGCTVVYKVGNYSSDEIEAMLSDLPAADVAPVRHETPMLRCRPERYERYEECGLNKDGEGLYLKRIFVDEKSYAMYCPACGKRLCSRFKSFCPNCGAKMDKEDTE